MRRIQNRWHKLLSIVTLGFLVAIGMTACEINTTAQSCDGIVNVNSCTSSNSITIQATAEEQATIQANIDATATVVATVQKTTTKNEHIVSIGIIILPLTLLFGVIALLFSFGQDATTPKVTLSILTILLLILIAVAIFNVVNLGVNI